MDWTSIRAQAHERMTGAGWTYNEGAADIGDQADYDTLAWRRLAVVPRAFHDVTTIDTGITFAGVRLAAPLFVAPTAYHRLADDRAEIASAEGARQAGSFMVYPCNASVPVEEFAATVEGPWWSQVYLFRDRDASARYVERAVDAGAQALMLTVDVPGFTGDFGFRNGIDGSSEGASGNFPAMRLTDWAPNLATDLTVRDIVWLHELSGLPVHVKGIMRPGDARAAVDAGAAGIMVSNHGRRQIDGVLPVADALPGIVRAVGGRVPVSADGGIRSGGDVFRALALGATSVGLGRPVQWGLGARGVEGVRDVFRGLTDELAHLMSAAGVSRIGDIDASFVVPERGPAAIGSETTLF